MKVIAVVEEPLDGEKYFLRLERSGAVIFSKEKLVTGGSYIFKEVKELQGNKDIFENVGKILTYKKLNFPSISAESKNKLAVTINKLNTSNQDNEDGIQVTPFEELLAGRGGEKGQPIKAITGVVKSCQPKIDSGRGASRLIELKDLSGDTVSLYLYKG